jgi:non-ribosomal peptide synthetase-like protein
LNAEYSNSSFRVSRTSIGATNFLGNFVTFPAAARTGDNCLFASKVLVPLDGKVREGVGLLGSPSFEIPRSVERDSRFDHLTRGDAFRRSLFAKTRHNTGTIVAFLFARWLFVLGLTVLSQAGVGLAGRFGISSIAVAVVLGVLYTIWYFVLAERAAMGFRALRPQFCSIYEPYFWRHERLWKLNAMEVLELCNGTPFKGIVWRALGVRIGRRVFDDGCSMPEKSLVRIGSHSMLNVGSCLQCHSLEDGTFKSGYITIGAGCTVGTMALVHYGVNMGDRSMVDADSFLMKGEEVAAWSRWRGNPAREVGSAAAALPQVTLRSVGRVEATR